MSLNIFFFDGDCSFCSGLAEGLKKRCLDPEVEFRSFRNLSEEELKKIHPSLDKNLVQGNVQYILGQQRFPGFFAVRKLSHSLKGWRYLSPLLYLPLVPLLGILVMSLLKFWKTR
ncbi:DCC1-like thiol-disulfide oxidoreductase family protein [Leptospira wolffii]|uniref:DCC1-like thiol-disulfide oxidoreductase family protein n=1 Tax=Leptospira wolffii TaxID=409998 RepID=A0ABV5BN62_9LEPT